MKKTTDAVEIMKDMIGDDPQLHDWYNEATLNAHVAQLIYDARTEAGLSQKELAEMIGTTQSVISRLEDADYEGHSLSMLSRIATALNREVKIAFVPIPPHVGDASVSQSSL
jgi:ribosome-binding protein aMBF1 (putative translation factor)